jgi:prepilin-type N-terminal cleavage/methylation domain-containing protein
MFTHAGRRGFTIIEVVTVMAIIGILAALTVRSGTPGKNTISLEREAQAVADLVRVARQNSIAITENEGTFPSYAVALSSGGSTIEMQAIDISYSALDPSDNQFANGICSQSSAVVESHTLGGGVSIASIRHSRKNNQSDVLILFARPLPTTFLMKCSGRETLGAGELQILLQNADGNQRLVTVNSAGKVSVSLPPQP